jgi:hypothetical protein
LQFDRQSVDGKKDTEPYQFRQLRRFWAPVERPKPLTRCQGFWTSAPYFHRQAALFVRNQWRLQKRDFGSRCAF